MSNQIIKVAIALAAAVTFSGSASAAEPAAGRKLAEQYCAKCHDIEAGAPFKLSPPSFAAIAVYRSEDDIRSRMVWPVSHVGMPQFSLVLRAEEFDDITAYIVSLEKSAP